MKKLSITLFVLVLLILAVYASLLSVSEKLDAEAKTAVMSYEKKLNEHKKLNGEYPNTLDGINIKREKILIFISPIEIRYIKSDFIGLYYNQFPLGPKNVYNLSNRVWSFEE